MQLVVICRKSNEKLLLSCQKLSLHEKVKETSKSTHNEAVAQPVREYGEIKREY
jgi:hypothetical protein